MTNQNTKTKIRRRKQDKENAIKGGKSKEMKLDQKEQIIYNEAKDGIAIARTNQQNIIGINKDIIELSKMINAFDTKMSQYDAEDVRPRFVKIENKQNAMIDFLINLADILEIELTEEQMKIFELEEIKEAEVVDQDIETTEQVLEKGKKHIQALENSEKEEVVEDEEVITTNE